MKTSKEFFNGVNNKVDFKELDDGELKKLKKILTEICSDIIEFCDDNNLTCMLCGGSTLGAVRHKGFIPWDDDADLMMPREDYDKFSKLFSEAMREKYDVFVPDGMHIATTSYMRVALKGTVLEDVFHVGDESNSGISVDIFALDDAPNSNIASILKGCISDWYLHIVVSVLYYQNRNDTIKAFFDTSIKSKLIYFLRCSIGFLLSFKNYQWWFERYDRFVKAKHSTDYCTIPTGRKRYYGERHHKSVFYPPVNCEFEGLHAKIPNNVDTYLRALYGNYMEIPPVEKREKHFYTKIDFGKY